MPLFIQNTNVFNITSLGADPSGTLDSTSAIAAAISQASASRGIVYVPAGTYISGNQSLQTTNPVHIWGAGKDRSIIKLKNGANTDLFSAYTSSINLAGAFGTGSTTGANFWGLHDLTLDGNKANQSSGPSYPIRVYGYGEVLEHVEIVNGFSGGILKDWNGGANPTPPNNAFMPQWLDVMVHDSNGILVEFGGPTDAQWYAVNGFAGGSHGCHIGPNATALRQTHCHFWATPVGNRSVTLLCEAPELVLTSCQMEGSDTASVVLLGSDNLSSNLEVGGTGDATRQGVGIQFGQNAGSTPYAGQVFQSGGLTTAAASNVNHIDAKLYQCQLGAINETNTSNNKYDLLAFQTAGTGIGSNGGFPVASSQGSMVVIGLTADGTPGKSGFVTINSGSFYGMQVYNTSGNVLFSLDTFDSVFQLKNGFSFSGYSDNGTTLKYSLNAADGSILLNNSSSLRSGTGAPAAGLGVNGDYYFRLDTPGTANQRLYVKSAGAWTGIL